MTKRKKTDFGRIVIISVVAGTWFFLVTVLPDMVGVVDAFLYSSLITGGLAAILVVYYEIWRERWKKKVSSEKLRVGLDRNFQNYTPYEFEVFIAKLLERMGYKTKVTRKTADYGIDVVARNSDETLGVQVKRFEEGNRVGAKAVQNTLGSGYKVNADRTILVTSSGFTANARAQAKDAPIELWDKKRLHELIRKYFVEFDKGVGQSEKKRKRRPSFWIGAIPAFIIVSLVLAIAINTQLREDIFGGGESGDILKPSEVRENPSKYLGKEITVEGYYTMDFLSEQKSLAASDKIYLTNTENFDLFDGEEYRVTGIFQDSDSVGVDVELQVSDVKPTKENEETVIVA